MVNNNNIVGLLYEIYEVSPFLRNTFRPASNPMMRRAAEAILLRLKKYNDRFLTDILLCTENHKTIIFPGVQVPSEDPKLNISRLAHLS